MSENTINAKEAKGTIQAENIGTVNQHYGSGDQVVQFVQYFQGIPFEEFVKISKELGVTQTALKTFYQELKLGKVQISDLDHTLRTLAADYKQLANQNSLDKESVEKARNSASKHWNTLLYSAGLLAAFKIGTEVQKHKDVSDEDTKPVKKETTRDGQFVAYQNGTVLDKRTGLMWAAKDNGGVFIWKDAKRYCARYRGGGYSDWRLPTIKELKELYDAGLRSEKGIISLSGYGVWSSEFKETIDGSRAAHFFFSNGNRYWGYPDDATRVLPVRGRN